MAFKTKRSSARTALLASASLALVRGTHAATPTFANAIPSGGDCTDLRFDAAGDVIAYAASGAAGHFAYVAGYAAAVNKVGASPIDGYDDCQVAAGFYLAAAATAGGGGGLLGDDAGDTLDVQPLPVNFYYDGSGTLALDNAGSATLFDPTANTNAGNAANAASGNLVYKCKTGTETKQIASNSLSDCVTAGGYYLQTASTTYATVAVATAPAGWYSEGGVSVTDTTKASGTGTAGAGTLDSSSTKDVQKCAAGTASASAGLSSCTPCSAGEYSAAAATACTVCAANTYTDVTGSTSCTACPTMNGVATVTTGTSAATHNDITDCFADLDATQAAAIGALDVVPGFIATATTLNDAKLRVSVCPTGTFGETWTPSNTLTDGGVLLEGGAGAVTYCAYTLPGYYADTQGSAAHASASNNFDSCPDNASSDAVSLYSDDCSCDSGYYYNFGACVAWPAAASPTAASPTAADSAGASTPIAVALAAAAAVPLLL